MTDALDASGVILGELEYWRESDPDFRDLERQLLQQKADDVLRKQVDAYVRAGDRDIIKAAMRRLGEYNPAKQTKVTVDGEIKHRHLDGKKEEDLDAIIRAGLAVDAEWEEVRAEKQITEA